MFSINDRVLILPCPGDKTFGACDYNVGYIVGLEAMREGITNPCFEVECNGVLLGVTKEFLRKLDNVPRETIQLSEEMA